MSELTTQTEKSTNVQQKKDVQKSADEQAAPTEGWKSRLKVQLKGMDGYRAQKDTLSPSSKTDLTSAIQRKKR